MRTAWRRPGVAAGALWALTMLGLVATFWFDHLLRRAGRPEFAYLSPPNLPEAVAALSAATVGAVLASRRPAHPVGWLLLVLGLLGPFAGIANAYAHYGVMVRPGTLPAAGYLAGISNGANFLWLSCAGFVALLTPTGSLPSPRWRWWARVAAAAGAVLLLASVLDPHPLTPEDPGFVSPLAAPSPLAGPLGVAGGICIVTVLVALVVATASLLLRFRRARGVERRQLRWVAVGAALAAVALLAAVAAAVTGLADSVVVTAAEICVAMLPLATGAAILRYRLYDLDRIVSRTLAYGLLTVLLGLAYAAVVLGFGRLLPQGSSLAVAAATLAVAGLFQPARRRVQRAVDQRFDRRRYDAAQTIQAFSARLRQQVDLDTLTAELLGVVDQTVQPTRASLWLRQGGVSRSTPVVTSARKPSSTVTPRPGPSGT